MGLKEDADKGIVDLKDSRAEITRLREALIDQGDKTIRLALVNMFEQEVAKNTKLEAKAWTLVTRMLTELAKSPVPKTKPTRFFGF